jgi:hypothetical protein|tara:strand:+ start:1719 stop:3869 length:2151 start_codon:yes stop_codon:yes gene_type:complete
MFKLKFFITLIVLLCTTAFAQITGPKVGEVIGQMGTTWNEREGKTQNTSTGYELQMKDFLQTGEDGGMILNYADGTKFTMGPNTELTIDEFAFDTSVIPIELAMNVSVNVGTFTYESGKVSTLGGEVNISAGNATITVQGTAFSGRVDTSGHATITLLPDSQGNVGQVTVSNDAGSQTITNAFSSVTVFGNDLAPTPPRIETDKRKIIQLDSFEEEIRDETERGFGDVDTKSSNAQNSEDAIFNEESNIVEDSNTIIQTDMSISESDSMIELESKEEKALEAAGTAAEAEIDTSYYDDYEEDLKDWGYIDEDNQISVWDADGESKMDWDDAKKMYAEMDQAYFDAIGCESGCNYDTIDWDSIDWDNVDWDAYDKAYNDTLEKYGLTSYNSTVEEVDVVEDTKGETEAGLDGYDWEDFMMDDNYYSNAEYKSKGGPPKLTVQNYCEYNGYEDYWCNQEYVDYLNDWYKNDWYLKVTATSWDTKSKDIFGKLFGWCGNWPDYKMCENQPKPWKMKDLKDKYITEWDYNDYNTYYDAAYDWWYTGYDYNNETDETNWEDEYAYEDNYDIDAELEILLASYDEDQCMKYGYFWSVAGQSCGTEWVDNEGNETKVTASGEILNYTTGDVTQTLTSSDTSTGATSSATATGRVSTLNNNSDATASAADGFTTLNRYNDNHRAYIITDTSEEADIQIIQDSEAQHLDVGTSAAQSNITIIQTN